jgi:hypothetical protein
MNGESRRMINGLDRMVTDMQEKTKQRIKIAGSLVAGGASVAALVWALRHPLQDGPAQLCPPATACPTAPVKDDGRCEVSKGEADPISPTFDPSSCGYCGDGIRQVMTTSLTGMRPHLDSSGAMVQEVTERQSETPDTCPVDFHCGNGKQDRNEPYSGWMPSLTESGALTFSLIRITETSQDCARDNPPVRRSSRQDDDGGPEDPLPVFQTGQVWSCPSQLASTNPDDVVASQSGMLQSIIRRVAGITSHSQEIRSALHVADPATRVVVSVSLLVDTSGSISIRQVSATCGGSPCGDQVTILNASQLSLSGLYMPSAPGTQCLWTHNVTLQRGEPLPSAAASSSPKKR